MANTLNQNRSEKEYLITKYSSLENRLINSLLKKKRGKYSFLQ